MDSDGTKPNISDLNGRVREKKFWRVEFDLSWPGFLTEQFRINPNTIHFHFTVPPGPCEAPLRPVKPEFRFNSAQVSPFHLILFAKVPYYQHKQDVFGLICINSYPNIFLRRWGGCLTIPQRHWGPLGPHNTIAHTHALLSNLVTRFCVGWNYS